MDNFLAISPGLRRQVSLHLGALLALSGASSALPAQQVNPGENTTRTAVAPALVGSSIPGLNSDERVDGTFAFVENKGQWPTPVRFVHQIPGLVAFIEPSAITLELRDGHPGLPARTTQLRLEFENARSTAIPVGVGELPTTFNFFIGTDPARWRSDVRGFGRVLLEDVYSGIDFLVRSSNENLEYDVLLSPGASLDLVRVRCDGAEALSIDPDGSLVIEAALGDLRQPTPTTWEITPDGISHRLPCRYRLLGSNRFGFIVDGWSGCTPLIIDPGLEWSTYLGAEGHETVHAVAIAGNGDVLVAGRTESLGFPTTPGVVDQTCSFTTTCSDGFISRLSADGKSLVFSTFIGGSLTDRVDDLEIDATGNITLIGRTGSTDFPVTPGALNFGGPAGSSDIFVTRLTGDGSSIIASARFGGTIGEDPKGGTLDASGNVIVFGQTSSSDFPTTPGAFDGIKNQNGDGFLVRVSADGSQILYGSYLGGDGPDSIDAAVLESSGRLLLTAIGGGDGPRFPAATPGAFDTTHNSIYVARLSPDWSAIETATFLGGISGERSRAIASGPDGTVVVAGWTFSADFPVTPGAVQENAPSTLATSGFVTCFNSSLSSLIFSTYLGGGPTAEVHSVHMDASGQVTVAGRTDGGGFPVTPGAFDLLPQGVDCFVTRFSPDGRRLNYSTFLGGSLGETISTTSIVAALAVDPLGSAVIATHSNSTDYPVTPGAFQTSLAGGLDAVITHLDMLPAGVSKFGTSTPGCLGPLAAGVSSMPNVGNTGFAVTCTAAPHSSTQGLLVVSMASLSMPLTAVGAQLWLDPTQLAGIVPVKSFETGFSVVGLRIPEGPAVVGLGAFVQFFWVDPCGPSGWSASNALHIVVQP